MTRPQLSNRKEIEAHQLKTLRQLIGTLRKSNPFYRERLEAAGLDRDLTSIDDFVARMPFTTKQQIMADQTDHLPYGTNLTFPLEKYTRFCQTSGTTGAPMRWLDTADGWQWMLDNWAEVFCAAGARPADRVFFAFSFGPFLGFWTAFEAATQLGMMAIPGGGMSSAGRLHTIRDNDVTVLCCTPTYAIRLAEVARQERIDLDRLKIRKIIVAGDPGGSWPAPRLHIESLWSGAQVFDHHGMTEVGPVSFENPQRPGLLHIMETAYLAEIVDTQTRYAVPRGKHGELVLTTLGRAGSPLLRYRTGDLVRQSPLDPKTLGRPEMALEGGILGRTDDMVLVRGVNVYPSAVDQIVRADEHVAEYQVEISEGSSLTEMRLKVEPTGECRDTDELTQRLAAALQDRLQLRVPVDLAELDQLPRFEMKAKRWVRMSDP